MMKNTTLTLLFFFVLTPYISNASTSNNRIEEYENILRSGSFACEERQYVAFGNGIRTEHQDALDSTGVIQEQITPKLTSLQKDTTDFGNIYNPTVNTFVDMWESINQKSKADIKQYRLWFLGIDEFPNVFEGIFRSPSILLDPSFLATSPTTYKQIEQYNSLLSKGRNVAAITHSQGNLFINEAYFGIHDPLLDGIGIVSVANPDNTVADKSDNHKFENTAFFNKKEDIFYINLEEDLFMVAAGTQLGNFNNYYYSLFPPSGTNLGHNFIDAYMDKNANGVRTAAQVIVDETLARLEKTSSPACRTPLVTAPNGELAGEVRIVENDKETTAVPYKNELVLPPPHIDFINWRGDYENKIAQKSISYLGPSARFIGTWGYANIIYRDGRRFYAFDHGNHILGAALTTDHQGEEWVIAVVMDEKETVNTIYKRRVKVVNGLKVVDLDTEIGFNPMKPTWIKIGQFIPSADSSLYSPWFFNGDGTEAQTLRQKTERLIFWDNKCPYNEYCLDTVSSEHDVSVINRYKLTVSPDLSSASVSNLGYETGDTGLIAVDYLDDQELLLRTTNVRKSGADPMDVPYKDVKWLELNGEPIMDHRILKCRKKFQYACNPYRDTYFSPNWDGLIGQWSALDFHTFTEVHILHIYFMDLRTITFEFSSAHQTISQSDFRNYFDGADMAVYFGEADVEYYYSHQDGEPKLMGKINNLDSVVYKTAYSSSPFGRAGSFWNAYDADYLTPPVRGQYAYTIDINAAPMPLQSGRVIEPDGSLLISTSLPDRSVFNYYSKGDLATLLKADLSKDTVLPVGLN